MSESPSKPSRVTSEWLRRTIRLANQLSVKDIPLPLLRDDLRDQYSSLIESVEHLLLASHRRRQLILPELSAFNNQSLGIFSDYSGEGSGHYFVYSVLVCGLNMRAHLDAQMAEIRSRFELGSKEIAYKDLSMGQMRRALPEYLAASDLLPGLLCTIAVDKKIESVFTNEPNARRQLVGMLQDAELGAWKPAVAEKLLRVVHLAAYLAVLLGRNGQDVFWMTDNDEICPTPSHHLRLLEAFARVLQIYQRPSSSFDKIGGATPFAERSVELNDLLSLPDLAAGVLGDYLSKSDVLPHDEIRVKEGTEDIMLWFGRQGVGLKKFCAFLRPGPGGSIERGRLDFSAKDPPPQILIPIYD